MILIVGLGNPGTNYINTRHNIGFIAVDIISDRYNFSWQNKSKFNADIASGDCELGKVMLCKPRTYMNLSGVAIQSLASFYKIPIQNIIVIHDDIDLSIGKIKYKIGGSAGGHNGLKSLDNTIGAHYQRIRVGIGRPEHPMYDVSDYVLSKFSISEEELIKTKLNILVNHLKLLINGELEKFKRQISL